MKSETFSQQDCASTSKTKVDPQWTGHCERRWDSNNNGWVTPASYKRTACTAGGNMTVTFYTDSACTAGAVVDQSFEEGVCHPGSSSMYMKYTCAATIPSSASCYKARYYTEATCASVAFEERMPFGLCRPDYNPGESAKYVKVQAAGGNVTASYYTDNSCATSHSSPGMTFPQTCHYQNEGYWVSVSPLDQVDNGCADLGGTSGGTSGGSSGTASLAKSVLVSLKMMAVVVLAHFAW